MTLDPSAGAARSGTPSTPRQPRETTGTVAPRRILYAVAGAAALTTILGGVLFIRYTAKAAGDPGRIAVAPFDLPDSAGAVLPWRVGLATALTERLPADGRFGTVPQEDVARVWRARATPIIAAVELARRSAAGLALYGRVDREAGDSLRLRAALIDANSARGIVEVAVLVPPDTDLERAADTLTAILLARLDAP